MIPKENRLKNKDDFQATYLKGKFFSSGPVTVKIAPNAQTISRFGFVIGKNYDKKAVGRNRAKRMLRAATSPLVEKIVPGYDLVIGLRKPLSGQKVDVTTITSSLDMIFKNNNLLK